MILEIISILAVFLVLLLSLAIILQRKIIFSLKRQRDQLSKIMDLDLQRNVLSRSQEDFRDRLNYLRDCMSRYRMEKGR